MTKLTATITLNGQSNGVYMLRGVSLDVADLPELTGSQKQVDWARKIRATAIEAIADGMNAALDRGFPSHMCHEPEFVRVSQTTQKAADLIAAGLTVRTGASWWIDNRDELKRNAVASLIVK